MKLYNCICYFFVILFFSSFQMIALGIIGEYVWRGLEASRNRPSYLIEKKLGEFN